MPTEHAVSEVAKFLSLLKDSGAVNARASSARGFLLVIAYCVIVGSPVGGQGNTNINHGRPAAVVSSANRSIKNNTGGGITTQRHQFARMDKRSKKTSLPDGGKGSASIERKSASFSTTPPPRLSLIEVKGYCWLQGNSRWFRRLLVGSRKSTRLRQLPPGCCAERWCRRRRKREGAASTNLEVIGASIRVRAASANPTASVSRERRACVASASMDTRHRWTDPSANWLLSAEKRRIAATPCPFSSSVEKKWRDIWVPVRCFVV